MSLILDGTTPADFNLPPKFKQWRPSQKEGVEEVILADHPTIVLCQPTGSGKSAVPVMIQKMTQEKLVILTATKSLQDQYTDDFARCGMADMRGLSNYKCFSGDAKPWWTCENGAEEGCNLYLTNQCQYSAAKTKFAQSDLGVTNYQFWMHSRRSSPESLGDVRTLVLDECHEAFDQVSKFLEVRIRWDEAPLPNKLPNFTGAKKKGGLFLEKWQTWATEARAEVKRHLASFDEQDLVEKKRAREMEQKLWRICTMTEGDWVWEPDPKGVTFECIWPGKYTKSVLFSGVQRVVLISGTVRPYTLKLLGIGKKDYKFKEWPKVFPLNRMPFIHIPTLKMTYGTDQDELQAMVARVDEIIEGRLDRKGLVHTKSYTRALFLQKHSRFGRRMLLNDSRSTRDIADRFRKSKPPSILVSPSYSTGWDFPYSQLEYQIIVKVPFDVTTTQLAKQRKKDKKFMLYSVMQELIQMRGRGMRAEDDRCENFIIDDQCQWVVPVGIRSGMSPNWFNMRTSLDCPNPPEKLSK